MIELVPMDEQDLEEYLKTAIENYANEKVKSGTWGRDEAMEMSKDEFKKHLPDGIKTKGQYLYTARDAATNRKIGMIWIGIGETEITGAWIWDFLIYESERGKGFGTQTLRALDDTLAKLGQRRVLLHVFGHNEIAINLYKKSGYHIIDLWMSKEI